MLVRWKQKHIFGEYQARKLANDLIVSSAIHIHLTSICVLLI